MAWSDLKPDADLHYAGEEQYLSTLLLGLSDSVRGVVAIQDVFLAAAKGIVLDDLGRAIGVNPKTAAGMEIVDRLASPGEDPDPEADTVGILQRAIAAKQLEIVFTRFPGATGDLNETKRQQYARAYRGISSGFYNMIKGSSQLPAQTVRVRL